MSAILEDIRLVQGKESDRLTVFFKILELKSIKKLNFRAKNLDCDLQAILTNFFRVKIRNSLIF